MGFDEVGITIGIVVSGLWHENVAVYEVLAHLLNFVHKFTRTLTVFLAEIDHGTEYDRAKFLGACFVVLPLFVTSIIVFGHDVTNTTTGNNRTVVPDWYTKDLAFVAALIGFAATIPKIVTTNASDVGKSGFN